MSLLSKLKRLFGNANPAASQNDEGGRWRSLITPLGVTSALCPYCSHPFEKMPQRKRRCPSCGETFLSRKRPYDDEKVLLTIPDANAADAQKELLGISAGQSLTDAQLDTILSAVESRIPHLVAEDLVAEVGAFLEKRHADEWNWGLYRNARLRTSESLTRRGLSEEALRTLLHVCYLDLNGPSNVGTSVGFPAFNTSQAMLAPAVLKRVKSIVGELKWESDDLQREFLALPGVPDPKAMLPVSKDESLRKLLAELGI